MTDVLVQIINWLLYFFFVGGAIGGWMMMVLVLVAFKGELDFMKRKRKDET